MYSVLTDEAKFISRKVYPGGIRREWVWDLQKDDNGVFLPKVTSIGLSIRNPAWMSLRPAKGWQWCFSPKGHWHGANEGAFDDKVKR